MHELDELLKHSGVDDVLIHGAKKGMKWGFSNGKRNGKRVAKSVKNKIDEASDSVKEIIDKAGDKTKTTILNTKAYDMYYRKHQQKEAIKTIRASLDGKKYTPKVIPKSGVQKKRELEISKAISDAFKKQPKLSPSEEREQKRRNDFWNNAVEKARNERIKRDVNR